MLVLKCLQDDREENKYTCGLRYMAYEKDGKFKFVSSGELLELRQVGIRYMTPDGEVVFAKV